MKPLRILITGGDGVIGTALANELVSRGHSVVSLDLRHREDEVAFSIDTPERGNPLSYVRCDVAEYRQLLRAFRNWDGFDYVYHAAAEFGRWNGEDFCVTSDTPVLKSDLTWTPAGNLEIGDELIGFDEQGEGAAAQGDIQPFRRRRRYRKAIVLAAERKMAPIYRITLADGTILRSTAEHRWLMITQLQPAEPGFWAGERGREIMESVDNAPGHLASDKLHFVALANGMTYGQVASAYYNYYKKGWQFTRHAAEVPTRPLRWVRTDELSKYVDSASGLPRLFEVVHPEKNYASGYIAAAFDGEGHVRKGAMEFNQVGNNMLARMRSMLSELGFSYTEGEIARERLAALGYQPMFYIRLNGRKDVNRLMMLTRPVRLLPKWIDSCLIGATATSPDVIGISNVEPDGDAEIAAIRSSTKTYIAAGFGAHNTEQLWRTNVVGTKNIINLQQNDRFNLIHFSSSEVYGDWPALMVETVMDQYEIKQLNDYAMTKWVNEMQIRNSGMEFGTQTVVVRLFNTYGPGEFYSPYRSVNCRFLYSALTGIPWTVFRGHMRTSTFIPDTVRTLANIADNFRPGETYNIGGDKEHTIEELSDAVLEVTGASPELVTHGHPEPMTTKVKHVDTTKAVDHLGHKNTVDLRTGLKLTADWMRKVYCL